MFNLSGHIFFRLCTKPGTVHLYARLLCCLRGLIWAVALGIMFARQTMAKEYYVIFPHNQVVFKERRSLNIRILYAIKCWQLLTASWAWGVTQPVKCMLTLWTKLIGTCTAAVLRHSDVMWLHHSDVMWSPGMSSSLIVTEAVEFWPMSILPGILGSLCSRTKNRSLLSTSASSMTGMVTHCRLLALWSVVGVNTRRWAESPM